MSDEMQMAAAGDPPAAGVVLAEGLEVAAEEGVPEVDAHPCVAGGTVGISRRGRP
jgi:hypothetical protein